MSLNLNNIYHFEYKIKSIDGHGTVTKTVNLDLSKEEIVDFFPS